MPSPEIYTLSLHDALPIYLPRPLRRLERGVPAHQGDARGITAQVHGSQIGVRGDDGDRERIHPQHFGHDVGEDRIRSLADVGRDRKSTRLNSSHMSISYAVTRDLHSFPTRRSSDLSPAPAPPPGARRSRSSG